MGFRLVQQSVTLNSLE